MSRRTLQRRMDNHSVDDDQTISCGQREDDISRIFGSVPRNQRKRRDPPLRARGSFKDYKAGNAQKTMTVTAERPVIRLVPR